MRMSLAIALSLTAALAAPAFAGGDDSRGGSKTAPAPAAAEKDWSKHKGNIPFIVGREAGMKEAEFSGKPILFFYTATW